MMPLRKQLQTIQSQIHAAAIAAGRQPESVQFLAVSKGQPISAIQEAYACGLHHFGESYWQEASKKIKALANCSLHWHFLGRLQQNKIKHIASHFDWVHSVTREVELQTLSRHRAETLPPLQICIEIHLQHSLAKSGAGLSSLPDLVKQAIQLPRIQLRGLMVMLDPCLDQEMQRDAFKQTRDLLTELNQTYHLSCDALSMGMSRDFIMAIQAGSTWVRLGEALFGKRSAS